MMMASLEISQMDIETGSAGETNEEQGSCISQFFSTYDGYCYDNDDDDDIFVNCSSDQYGISESRRVSDCSIFIEGDQNEMVVLHVEEEKADCRICHLTLDDDDDGQSNNPGSGIAIQLGCCCKDDLGAAHKHCAEAWFKIKGNTTCEICNSIARNVFGGNESESPTLHRNVLAAIPSSSSSSSSPLSVEERSCFNGHKLVNFLLACMVFAFVVSWLFHFNIPS